MLELFNCQRWVPVTSLVLYYSLYTCVIGKHGTHLEKLLTGN